MQSVQPTANGTQAVPQIKVDVVGLGRPMLLAIGQDTYEISADLSSVLYVKIESWLTGLPTRTDDDAADAEGAVLLSKALGIDLAKALEYKPLARLGTLRFLAFRLGWTR